jgi:hypothetical protein
VLVVIVNEPEELPCDTQLDTCVKLLQLLDAYIKAWIPDPLLWHPAEINSNWAEVELAMKLSQELFSILPQNPGMLVLSGVYCPLVLPQYPFKLQIKGAFTQASAAGVAFKQEFGEARA